MSLKTARRVPRATYRLQLHREFPFSAATAIVDYLSSLGISDLYASPIFLSTPGSTHGYDVNDYRRVDLKLGGRDALRELHAKLQEREMGLLLDFVPNHMGINGPGLLNRWWRDVLEHGENSAYARFFDIDWNAGASDGRSQVLVPLLEDHYGRVLEAGKLSLVLEEGTLSVAYYEMRFPLSPQSYPAVLMPADDGAREARLAELLRELGALPWLRAREESAGANARTAELAARKQRLADLLAGDAGLRARVDARLQSLNGTEGNPASFDELDAILQQQHYRLAFWKAGVHETNYRRFFAIDTLIGLRMENPEVFRECHALLAELLHTGVVTGLRIDHIDGLRDPRQYLNRLQSLLADDGGGAASLYVVVEKILEDEESLPENWATHGTTGYEFIAQVAGVLVDSRAERRFTETYGAFTGETASFEDVVYAKKRLVLQEMFANAVTRLAHDLTELLQQDRRWRDVTRHELTVAVRELMAAHGVYRTYRGEDEPLTPQDRHTIERACAVAIARNRRLDAGPFELVRDVLAGDYPGDGVGGFLRERLVAWVLSFQQYTGAVMAKSVEDTAFYTYSRFVALNEVGGNPGRFGGTVAGFHTANIERLRRTPQALLASSTHDTKFGEDMRARLYALSEMPHAWRDWLAEWSEINRGHKTVRDGRAAPDANEEYRLYQMLLGAWPVDDADPDETFLTRIREHWRKAVNEAKRNTSWVHQNEPWMEAGDRFIAAILHPETGRAFLESFRPKARRLAHLGMINSLAQLVLKCTSPGVPDFYQGCERWNFSLVDPDNRRPVDFADNAAVARRAERAEWRTLLAQWEDGAVKLKLTRVLLALRAARPELFRAGEYRSLELTGRFADNAIAFERWREKERICVVVPRLTTALGCPPLGLVWADTAVEVTAAGGWRDALTGRRFDGGAPLALAEVFTDLPVAVLEVR
ncbi:MAG TPA: malto-oligosyltrehalose synthase [Opitutus sp.]|nr:malto-oligosyltrehalose synthase [Opitutus sp.]